MDGGGEEKERKGYEGEGPAPLTQIPVSAPGVNTCNC